MTEEKKNYKLFQKFINYMLGLINFKTFKVSSIFLDRGL